MGEFLEKLIVTGLIVFFAVLLGANETSASINVMHSPAGRVSKQVPAYANPADCTQGKCESPQRCGCEQPVSCASVHSSQPALLGDSIEVKTVKAQTFISTKNLVFWKGYTFLIDYPP